MTIKQKIIFSSTLVAILAGLAGVVMFKNMAIVKGKYRQKVEQWNEESLALENIQNAINTFDVEILKGMNPPETSAKEDNFIAATQHLKDLINKYGSLGDRQEETANVFYSYLPQMIGTGKSLLNSSVATMRMKNQEVLQLNSIQQEMSGAVVAAKAEGFEVCQREGLEAEHALSRIANWTMGISIMVFLLAIVFGRLIARDLSNALEDLKKASRRLERGDYKSVIASRRTDEFGKLAETFDHLTTDLQQSKIIQDQNQQLESMTEQLKKKNDSLDSFVYRVSHDLKAPVVNIQSLLGVLKAQLKEEENEVIQKTLFFMGKTSGKLQQTIHDLLEVSRIERSLVNPKEWISLKGVLEEVIIENSEVMADQGVVVTHNFDQVSEIYFSQPNLKSILSNLLNNSMKYSSAERMPEIHLHTQTSEEYICLSIADNGIGIDLEKHREKLFGMFNRFHSHVEGSGVGLYIVKKLMEESGGKLEIESEVDKGTTLRLFFKRDQTQSNPPLASASTNEMVINQTNSSN